MRRNLLPEILFLSLVLGTGVSAGGAQGTPNPSATPGSALPAGLQEPTQGPARFNPTFTHGNVTVDGVRLHYVRGGSGTPIVLLHGFPQTWWAWHGVMPELARTHTVIAFDLPGLGDSSVPPGGFDKATTARRIHAALVQLGVPRVSLVAHDIGMMVAYRLARDFPASVSHVVAVDALVPGYGLETLFNNGEPDQGSFHFAFNAHPQVAEPLVRGREETYFAYFYDTFAFGKGAIPPLTGRCTCRSTGVRARCERDSTTTRRYTGTGQTTAPPSAPS